MAGEDAAGGGDQARLPAFGEPVTGDEAVEPGPSQARATSIYPAAGYAVWWHGLDAWPDASRLSQTVITWSNYPSRAHKLADDMSVLVWAGGRAWLTNTGYWPYGVQGYDGAIWERAVEVIRPALKLQGGLPAGGMMLDLFYGKYRSTPTGIHLDSSDNLAFVVRGPKRLMFWPPESFAVKFASPPVNPSHQQALTGRFDYADTWLNMADALASRGNTLDAAKLLQSQAERHPGDYKLWVGLGNALTDHARTITPAGRLAFERAAELAPGYPAPPFFLGLAEARSGNPKEAVRLWQDILANAPANASWRPMIEDGVLMMGGGAASPPPNTPQAGS